MLDSSGIKKVGLERQSQLIREARDVLAADSGVNKEAASRLDKNSVCCYKRFNSYKS
jgi:hypothetical protein